jgi:cytochrome c-type biogenesis protein CcmH
LAAFIVLALAMVLAAPLLAQDHMPPAPYAYRQLDDPALEAKAQALMETIRCLKCQSQSIADSDAQMAGDMRSEIRMRIANGESPAHIRQWLIDRYGNYVSYEPQVNSVTWPLYVIPILLLVIGLSLMRHRFRRRA